MHGYFIDNRLYQKAKTQFNPFALETYKQEEIDKKIREETKRAPIKKKVKVSGVLKTFIFKRRFKTLQIESLSQLEKFPILEL